MHIDCRRTHGGKHFQAWFYRWGFGVWVGRFLFGFGHDTRSRVVVSDPEHVKKCWTPTRKHFFEYLSPSTGPVIPELEAFEVVYAKDQPEYIPLRSLAGNSPERPVLSRWALTPEQREAVADGADIFLELLTFRDKYGNPRPLQPIRLMVADQGPNPDYLRHEYQLNNCGEQETPLHKM